MYHLNMIKFFTLAALVAATSTFAFASDDLNKGFVNWTEGYIDGVGYGTAQPSGNKGKDRIKARRVAEVTAQRTLLETIKGVQIDSMTTVENSMLTEDVIKSRVEGVVKGAQIVDEKLEWDGNAPTVMVKMRICMLGGPSECKGPSLVNALDLEKKPDPPFVPQKVLLVVAPPQPPQEPPAVITPPPPAQPVNVYPFDSSKPATGVVFALEGRYFEKSLMPVVITYSAQDGPVTVYSAKIVKPAVIRTYGAVRYADTVDNALTIPQVGKNVLVIPASDITKENMIVIRAQDAVKIKDTLAHGNDYLSDAKVVISGR